MSNRFKPAVVAFIAAIALAMLGARNALAQDGDAAGGPDANWEAVSQVLELPRACDSDGVRVPCDHSGSATASDSSGDDDDDDDDGNATARRGTPAAPPTLDDDTASNQPAPNADWGTVDEYETESITPVPFGVYVARGPSYGGLQSLPPSAYPISPMASSLPLSPAATPPLGSARGPWLSPASPSWGNPGGMMMPGRSFPSH